MVGKLEASYQSYIQRSQNEHMRQLLNDRQNVHMRYYNRSAKDLNSLKTGEQVLVKRNYNHPLQPASVKNTCERPRSYKLEFSDGSILDRNRRHIYKAPSHQAIVEYNMEPESHQNTLPDENFHIPKDGDQAVSNTSMIQNGNNSSSVPDSSMIKTRASRVVKPPAYIKDSITY